MTTKTKPTIEERLAVYGMEYRFVLSTTIPKDNISIWNDGWAKRFGADSHYISVSGDVLWGDGTAARPLDDLVAADYMTTEEAKVISRIRWEEWNKARDALTVPKGLLERI